MECTQRLESTQEIYSTQSERICPEQIGFLGILGKKYPVKKGPNKIGRDPQTCNIILNLNSVSRQHAVINILNTKDFMIMDLDSANKTKLMGKTLQAYIPQPLSNGDMVQFGEIFGVFRLFEEEDDLPMTQALDIPDTPVPMKYVSRVNAVTTVPESPDVSDKDDSFIVPSQPKVPSFHSPKTRNFIKPGKTISIQPLGSNKIDNVYWNSSKKSTSFNLDDSNTSLDDLPSLKLENKESEVINNIHELETQMMPGQKDLNEDKGSIHTANTQLPEPFDIHTANTQLPNLGDIHTAITQLPNGCSPSIHTMNTQMPCGSSPSIHNINTQMPPEFGSPSIHNLETQMPASNLPEVCKITEQEEMQFDLCANKNNDSVVNDDEKLFTSEKENIPNNSCINNDSPPRITKLSTSHDEVLFDEIDQPYEEPPESQAILSEDIDLPINRLVEPEFEVLSQIVKPKSAKRNMRIRSNSSADSEDIEILPTQKIIIENKDVEDDVTDCEDDMIELKVDKTTTYKDIDKVVSFEDIPTQIIEKNETSKNVNNDIDFEDMPTQVLSHIDVVEKNVITTRPNPDIDNDFENLPTQVLGEDLLFNNKITNTKKLTVEEENSPFKIPFNSALKAKRASKTPKMNLISSNSNIDDHKYYQETQDIYDDLCTQKLEFLPDEGNTDKQNIGKKLFLDTSVIEETENKIDDFVRNLSNKEVLEVIGVDNQIAPVKKFPSDSSTASESENTPKKARLRMDIDLPDSQEIKNMTRTKPVFTESSSDSETENNSEEQCTPILFRKKTKPKPDAKMALAKKFNLDALPSRVITRVRKPTVKLLDEQNKTAENILKPKFLTEQESEMDKEIITENISRLKSKNEKVKNAKTNHSINDTKQVDVEISIPEIVKKARSSKKKIEEVTEIKLDSSKKKIEEVTEIKLDSSKKKIEGATEIKLEIKPEKSKDGNKSKAGERRKWEPRNTKKNLQESKNQSKSNISTNQSISETKEHTQNKVNDDISHDLTKSPVGTKRTRSVRNAKTAKADEKLAVPDKEKLPEKRKYHTRKATKTDNKEEKRKESPEKVIRRSRRQKVVKEEIKKESNPKSILKNSSILNHEESAVYNLSSGSNSDNSRSFKRPILDYSEVPSPKRTRSVAANSNAVLSRMTPSRGLKTQHVLFTAFPYGEIKLKLENMGAIVVTDLLQSTMVLTKQIKRTFKLLCAVGMGKPIVGPSWVQACSDNNTIVDPWLYIIKDEVAERRFHFSLERTLTGKRNFLKGYNISSTPKVMPEAHEMKLIVECSGGTWKEGGSQWICVSVPDDATLWPSLRDRGATIVSTEFILGGVLRQRLDIDANRFK